jgi:hypothetical protein
MSSLHRLLPAPGHGPLGSEGVPVPASRPPRGIPLLAHAQIQLDVGRPLVAPETIDFPPGL